MNRLALLVSGLVHPVLIPLLGCWMIVEHSGRRLRMGLPLLDLAGLFTLSFALPLGVVVLLLRMGKIESIHMEKAVDRRIPFVAAATGSVLSAFFLRWRGFGDYLPEWYLGIGFCLALLAALLPLLKASAHMAGIGGLLALSLLIDRQGSMDFGFRIAAILFATSAVAWARAHLDSHNSLELLVGWVCGVSSIALALLR